MIRLVSANRNRLSVRPELTSNSLACTGTSGGMSDLDRSYLQSAHVESTVRIVRDQIRKCPQAPGLCASCKTLVDDAFEIIDSGANEEIHQRAHRFFVLSWNLAINAAAEHFEKHGRRMAAMNEPGARMLILYSRAVRFMKRLP